MSDAPLEVCPKCGDQCEKKISAPRGFIFKGSGFYATDYKGDGNNPAGERSGFSKEAPHKNSTKDGIDSLGKSGTVYHDKQSKAPTGPEYQMTYPLKVK